MKYLIILALLMISIWLVLSWMARRVQGLAELATRAVATFDVCGIVVILYASYKLYTLWYGCFLVALMFIIAFSAPYDETQEETYEK